MCQRGEIIQIKALSITDRPQVKKKAVSVPLEYSREEEEGVSALWNTAGRRRWKSVPSRIQQGGGGSQCQVFAGAEM